MIDLLDNEPDPVELMAALSRKFAPATLTNTEGEPLVLCEATVRVDDPEGVKAALDESYDKAEGEEPPRWHEHVSSHGMPHIRATLVRDGDTLRVETNSAERMDRVLATLVRLDPTMRVVDDSRRPIRDAREAAELAEEMGAAEDALDPETPRLPRCSTNSSVSTKPSGSTNPSPHSTATRRGKPPTIPRSAAI